MVLAELRHGGAHEGALIPLAFDGVHVIAMARDHEVNFPPQPVPPAGNGCVGKMGLQVLQNEEFPERAEVSRAQ